LQRARDASESGNSRLAFDLWNQAVNLGSTAARDAIFVNYYYNYKFPDLQSRRAAYEDVERRTMAGRQAIVDEDARLGLASRTPASPSMDCVASPDALRQCMGNVFGGIIGLGLTFAAVGVVDEAIESSHNCAVKAPYQGFKDALGDAILQSMTHAAAAQYVGLNSQSPTEVRARADAIEATLTALFQRSEENGFIKREVYMRQVDYAFPNQPFKRKVASYAFDRYEACTRQ
jgi:hypothetical protein